MIWISITVVTDFFIAVRTEISAKSKIVVEAPPLPLTGFLGSATNTTSFVHVNFCFKFLVGRVGFEPTTLFRDWIMSPGPATNTASIPTYLLYYILI